jgi:hypothetical protein
MALAGDSRADAASNSATSRRACPLVNIAEASDLHIEFEIDFCGLG